MTDWRRAILVIEAADLETANADAQAAVPGCGRTFIAPLVAVADPMGPITHYWCGWTVTPRQYDALSRWFGTGTRLMLDGDTVEPPAVLRAMSLAPWLSGETEL